MNNTLAERILNRRKELGLTQEELAHRLGYKTKSTICRIESGDNDIPLNKVDVFAKALQTSRAYIMGWDDDSPAADRAPGAIPLVKKKIPLLGKVACGKPIYMNEEHEVWIPVDVDLDAEYAVEAKGDSMTGARIHDGDYVFIRPQPMVDNGTIALVCIGDEATLKRVYYYPDKRKLVLQAENPAYEPLIYSDEELEDVHILGKVMAFLSSVV